MAKLGDRILETTITTGTGTLSLAGAVSGYRTYLAAPDISTGDYVYYTIEGSDGSWESGAGIITAGTPDTLARSFIFDSSNSGSAISLPAGSHNVLCAPQASVPRICRVSRTASYSVPQDTWTEMPWDTEEQDDFSGWSSGVAGKIYTPSWASVVRIYAALHFNGGTTRQLWAETRLNASTTGIQAAPYTDISAAARKRLSMVSAQIPVSAGDYVGLYIYTGSNVDTVSNPSTSWFELEIIQ